MFSKAKKKNKKNEKQKQNKYMRVSPQQLFEICFLKKNAVDLFVRFVENKKKTYFESFSAGQYHCLSG